LEFKKKIEDAVDRLLIENIDNQTWETRLRLVFYAPNKFMGRRRDAEHLADEEAEAERRLREEKLLGAGTVAGKLMAEGRSAGEEGLNAHEQKAEQEKNDTSEFPEGKDPNRFMDAELGKKPFWSVSLYRFAIMTFGMTQSFSFLVNVDIQWPQFFYDIAQMLAVFNFSFEFFHPECSAKVL
jgi:hypothetical protein